MRSRNRTSTQVPGLFSRQLSQSLAALAGGTFLRSIGTGELSTAQHPERAPCHLSRWRQVTRNIVSPVK